MSHPNRIVYKPFLSHRFFNPFCRCAFCLYRLNELQEVTSQLVVDELTTAGEALPMTGLYEPVIDKDRIFPAVITPIPVIWDVSKVFLHTEHDCVATHAVRTSVNPLVVQPLQPCFQRLYQLMQEEENGIVGSKPCKKPMLGKRCDGDPKQQQDERDDDFRIILVEFKLPLPEFQLHRKHHSYEGYVKVTQ